MGYPWATNMKNQRWCFHPRLVGTAIEFWNDRDGGMLTIKSEFLELNNARLKYFLIMNLWRE